MLMLINFNYIVRNFTLFVGIGIAERLRARRIKNFGFSVIVMHIESQGIIATGQSTEIRMSSCRLICTCHPIHDLIAVFRVGRTDRINLISIIYVFSLKVRLETEVYPVLLKLSQSKILNPKPVVISKNGVVNLLIGTQVIFHGPVSRCGAFNAVSSPQISLFHFYAFTSGTKPFP